MEEFTLAMRRGLSPRDKLLKISGPQISWNSLFLVPLNLKVLQKSVINSLPLYHSPKIEYFQFTKILVILDFVQKLG